MRARRLGVAAALAALAIGGCGSSSSSIGPLTISPPEGWLVVDRQPGTLKVSNGTIGDETDTKAGDATAVFDIYVDSSQTLRDFRVVLKENNVPFDEEEIEIDSYDATIVSYRSSGFGPSSEVVFVPEWKVRIVYRAAFGDEESAFVRHRPDFRDALESITFEDRRTDRAFHGETAARRSFLRAS